MTDLNEIPQEVRQAVQKDAQAGLSWIQRHERILIVTLVLGFATWFGNHYLDVTASADRQKVVAAEQVLADQIAKNGQLAQQAQAAALDYQKTLSAVTQQNAQLAAAMASRTVILQQQQNVDKTLPLPDLGDRWSKLAGIAPSGLSASANGIVATPDAARQTVQQLEKVPVLEADLKDTQQTVSNTQNELGKAGTLIGSQQQQITGLNTQITDQAKACDAKVSSVKADDRRGKRNWFLRGVAAGAGIAIYVLLHA